MEINEVDLGDCKMNERKYVKEEFLIPIGDAIEAFRHQPFSKAYAKSIIFRKNLSFVTSNCQMIKKFFLPLQTKVQNL